jgi:hypothetical protein
MINGPDYSHGGEFVDWGDVPLNEHFVPLIEIARANMGQDVELFRWSREDPVVAEIERMWGKQRDAIKRHVGALSGLKMITTSRMHKDFGVMIAYVRFNRTRPVVVRDEVAS